MSFEISKPEFTFTWQWLVDLIHRILKDVFGFIEETEWAEKEEAAE